MFSGRFCPLGAHLASGACNGAELFKTIAPLSRLPHYHHIKIRKDARLRGVAGRFLFCERKHPPMDGIVLQALTPGNADEAAKLIRAAFAAQSRVTRPPSSALRETGDSVAAKIKAGGGIGAF